MKRTENIGPLLETALHLREVKYPDLSPEMVQRVLELHADAASDERARFRAVHDAIAAEVTE